MAAAAAASLPDVAPAVKAFLNSHFPSGPAAGRDVPAFLATLRAEEAHLHRQARARAALATFTFLRRIRQSLASGALLHPGTVVDSSGDVAAKEALVWQAVKATEDFQTGLQALLALCTRLDALKGQTAIVTQTAKPVLKELEEVATEVMALGRVQEYVESLLHLEQVNAGLEASVAALASMPGIRAGAQVASITSADASKLAVAVDQFQVAAKATASITSKRPSWSNLVANTNVRIDNSGAKLRPAALKELDSCLKASGWPPTLSDSASKSAIHPFLKLPDSARARLETSFVNVWAQRSGNLMWCMEAMARPLGKSAEHHFSQWLQQPEFVFALAFKLAREHAKVLEDVLQRGLDSADVRRSVWEEWTKAVAGLAANHLRNTALPLLAKMLEADESSIAAAAGPSPAATWLHTVDHTLRFDRSMAAFGDLTARETSAEVQEGGANPRWEGNALDVFAERKEWLQIWTRLELEDALQKLIKVLGNEESWQLADTLLGAEELAKEAGRSAVEFKPPVGAHSLVSLMRATTNRCATLSSREKRLAFVRDSVAPLADRYLQELLVQSQEAEGLTALATNHGLYKVARCLNAARYVAEYLQEWSEEVPMAELLHSFADDGQEGDAPSDSDEKSVFQEELEDLMSFADEWTGKIVSAIIRAFGARCTEYVQDKKRWREENTAQSLQRSAEGPLLPSQRLLEAVLEMEGKLDALSRVMDEFIFVDTWRRIAAGLDQYLMNKLVLGGASFSELGAKQVIADAEVLFSVFQKFTAKPASFFRNLRDTCNLLRLPTEEASAALLMITSAEDLPQHSNPSDALLAEVGHNVVRMLKEHGVTRMLPSMAGDILKRRLDLSRR
eukprot:SM000026S08993  [mRNA]  locus=s26:990072:995158:+ [translate_table: standard]